MRVTFDPLNCYDIWLYFFDFYQKKDLLFIRSLCKRRNN